MSIERVRAYFRERNMEDRVQEFDVSSATVELAAQALHVEGQRIAKTLSFYVDDHVVLIVAAGDAKIANPKYKAQFHTKAKMLSHEEACGGRRLPLCSQRGCGRVLGREPETV